jgi:hypothetical protein
MILASFYLGAGLATASISAGGYSASGATGVGQVGLETGIGNKIAIYSDGTFLSGGSIWKLGLGYRF